MQARRQWSEKFKEKNPHQLRLLQSMKLSFMSKRKLLSETKMEKVDLPCKKCQKKFIRGKESNIGQELGST